MKHDWIRWIAPATVMVGAATPGYATTYLTAEQAQQAIFPGAKFTPANVRLTPEQMKAIESASGVRVRLNEQKVWRASNGGWLIVDEALGKHEYITYALGLNADGTVRGVEVMEYRESYGYEIRNEAWRKQFAGKNSSARLKLDDDIKNISGATLSCRHITDGVKRLLAFYDVALRRS
jgi:FMN-binding domain